MTKELTLNKVAAALVGVAMAAGLAFAFAAERAHAVSLAELVDLFIALDIIPADKADEARAALANEEKTTPATPAAAACNFTRNLKTGDTGADVMELQKLLNGKGYTVAMAGAGSTGMETQYFGPATAAAVKRLQEAFASDILTPLGLTAGTGFFGASTRAKANMLCAPVVVPPVTGDDDDDDDTTVGDDDDDDDTLSGGEVSLEDFKRLGSPSSVDVAENEDKTKVAGWEFDVKDADGMLKRVDVNFEADDGSAGYSNKPYEYFDAVSLFLDGEEIAEEDASSKDDWSDLAGNVWQMRFTGLNEKLDEDATPGLVVAVTTMGNLDSEDEDTTWNVWVAEDGIRVQDGEGLDQYIGGADDELPETTAREFTTEGPGSDDELKVSLNSANPDSSIIKVDADDTTEDAVVLVFDLKAEGNDIAIDSLPITFTVPDDEEFADMVVDVKLDIDGEVFNDYTTASSTTSGTATTTFDLDEEVVVPEDGKVTVKVMVDLNSLTGNYTAGDTISAAVTSEGVDDIEGTGGDDLSATTNTGSATGETHELQSEGIFAEILSTDATIRTINNGTEDVVDFEIEFKLTAFDDTFYVGSTSAAIDYHVEKDGVSIGTASTTAPDLTSTASEESNGNYRLDEDSAKTFTFTVTVNPDLTGSYRVVLDGVDYSATNAGTVDDLSHTASPVSDFRTASKAVSQ